MATVHTVPCRHGCGRTLQRTTVRPNPPNLARLLAMMECVGDGCDPDQDEIPDDPDIFPMGEPDGD